MLTANELKRVAPKIFTTKNAVTIVGLFIVFTALMVLNSNEACARAGGGGGVGGGNCKSIWCIILAPLALAYTVYIGIRISLKHKRVSKVLAEMALKEPQWSAENLKNIAKDKFILLQNAWGAQDLDLIKKNLHLRLYISWEADIKNQIARNEKNTMSGLSVSKIRIVDAQNFHDDEKDEFTAAINASATDTVIRDEKIISSKSSQFLEFWTFEWENGEWLLKEVTQAEGWKRFVNASIIYEKPK